MIRHLKGTGKNVEEAEKKRSIYRPDFATYYKLINKLQFCIVFKVTNKYTKIADKVQETYVNAMQN